MRSAHTTPYRSLGRSRDRRRNAGNRELHGDDQLVRHDVRKGRKPMALQRARTRQITTNLETLSRRTTRSFCEAPKSRPLHRKVTERSKGRSLTRAKAAFPVLPTERAGAPRLAKEEKRTDSSLTACVSFPRTLSRFNTACVTETQILPPAFPPVSRHPRNVTAARNAPVRGAGRFRFHAATKPLNKKAASRRPFSGFENLAADRGKVNGEKVRSLDPLSHAS